MTEQQLRALRKKHLLVLALELQSNLQKAQSEKEQLMLEKEQLLLAYQCGLDQKQWGNDMYAIDSGQTDWPRLASQQQYAGTYPQQQWPVWQQQYPMQQIQPQETWQQQMYLWS